MADVFEFDVELVEQELIEVILQTVDVAPGTGTDSLANLTDTNIQNPQDQQYLRYNILTGKWENVDLDVLVQEHSIYNEAPTKIDSLTFETVNNFIAGSLRVFLNGIKEKNIVVAGTNRFTLPIDINEDDDIEVNYIKQI